MSGKHILFGYALRHPAVGHPFICAVQVRQPLVRAESEVHDVYASGFMPNWRLLAFTMKQRAQSFCRVNGPGLGVAVDFFRLERRDVPYIWHLPMEDLALHFKELERAYAANGRLIAIDFNDFASTLQIAQRTFGRSPFAFVGAEVTRSVGPRRSFTVRSVVAFVDCIRFVLEYAPDCSLMLTFIPHAGEGMRHIWREENFDGTYTDTEIGFQWKA